MKRFGLLLAACAIAASTLGTSGSGKPAEAKKYWVLEVGLIQATGDLKDAGVNTGYLANANYFFGAGNGQSNAEWYAGLGGLSGDGDDDFEFRAYGLHAGVLIGFGKPGDDNPWALDLRGGWYQARIRYTPLVGAVDRVDDKEDGFGWFAGIVYKSKSGPRYSVGFFTSSEVNGERGTGYYFTAGFPLAGK